jgi:hypothetical protein
MVLMCLDIRMKLGMLARNALTPFVATAVIFGAYGHCTAGPRHPKP